MAKIFYSGIYENYNYMVQNLKTGLDRKNKPIWYFQVPISNNLYGEVQTIAYVWIYVYGQCDVNEGDYVTIKKISGWQPRHSKSPNGANAIYQRLYCEVEKTEFRREQ